jgi:hypothetical protein
VHPIKLVFWTILFGALTTVYLPKVNDSYLLCAVFALVCFAACGFGLVVSVNHWFYQRAVREEERKKRSYQSIKGIDSRFQAWLK